jgi:hypothetical protein
MNQGTQGYNLTKKTEGRKSRDTVSLNDKSARVHCLLVNSLLTNTKRDASTIYCIFVMEKSFLHKDRAEKSA